MVTKKLTIIALISLFSIHGLSEMLLDNRSIKFEQYNQEELSELSKKVLPEGSNLDRAMEVLVDSKITKLRIYKIKDQDTQRWQSCKAAYAVTAYYRSPILSRTPKSLYTILFTTDANREIINLKIIKQNFLQSFW